MSATITAVYRDGSFHPTDPPALPDGATVRLVVVPDPPAVPPPPPPTLDEVLARIRATAAARGDSPTGPPDPAVALELMKMIAALPEEPDGDPTVTARDHDKVLYGSPKGVR